MLPSKRHNITSAPALILIILLTNLVGCLNPRQDPETNIITNPTQNSDELADFYLSKFSWHSAPGEETDPTWKVPRSKNFSYTVCLKHQLTNKEVINGRFRIQLGAEAFADVATDNNGCLSWSDIFPMDLLNPTSKYIHHPYKIIALHPNRGERNLQLAINPLASYRNDKNGDVVLLNTLEKQQLDPKYFIQEKSVPEKSYFGVENGKVKITHGQISVHPETKEEKVTLQMDLALTPFLNLANMEEELQKYYPNSGFFRLHAYLYVSETVNGVDNRDLLGEYHSANEIELRALDGKKKELVVNFGLPINRRPKYGQIELGLRLVPRDSSHQLGAFEGLFRLSDFQRLMNTHNLTALTDYNNSIDPTFSLAKIQVTPMAEKTSTSTVSTPLKPFLFSMLRVGFEAIGAGETATRRTVIFRVRTCVTRGLDQVPVIGREFVIFKQSENNAKNSNPQFTYAEKKATQEEDGCLSWQDSVAHAFYAPEELVPRSYIIKDVVTNSEYRMDLKINPWDYGWTLGRDQREINPGTFLIAADTKKDTDIGLDLRLLKEDPSFEEFKKRRPIRSKLFIDSFNYQTILFQYDIDDLLELTVHKTLLLRFEPKVLRYSSLTQGVFASGPIRDGVYLLKVAVQKDYLDFSKTHVALKPKTKNTCSRSIDRAEYLRCKNTLKVANDEGSSPNTSNKSGEVSYLELNDEIQGKEFISVVKKLVRVQYGKIITPVTISTNDLRLMRIRSNFFIQLETVREEDLDISSEMTTEDLKPEKVNKLLEEVARKELLYDNAALYMKDEAMLEAAVKSYADLDLLIDRDSGLASRTFIGPLILLSNSFYSGMRPTDDLSEIFCNVIDCNVLSENKRIKSYLRDSTDDRYFGHLRHLANQTVTDLIADWEQLQKQQQDENHLKALPGNYLSTLNLKYLSLANRPLKKVKNPSPEQEKFVCEAGDVQECQETVTAQQDPVNVIEMNPKILDYFNLKISTDIALGNSPYLSEETNQIKNPHYVRNFPQWQQQDLENFIKDPGQNENDLVRMCNFWVYFMMSDRIKLPDLVRPKKNSFFPSYASNYRHTQDRLLDTCLTTGKGKFSDALIIDQHLLIKEVSSQSFLRGESMNFNIGSNFSLGISENLSRTFVVGVDPLNVLKSFGHFLFDSVSGVFRMGFAKQASIAQGLTEGTSLSAGTYLAMQKNKMYVRLNKYERCLSIRLNPKVLIEAKMLAIDDETQHSSFSSGFFPTLSDQQKMDIATSGLFFCTGKIEEQPYDTIENYYYFTQHFTQGDMQDDGDLLNHPWLLMLRGESNYAKFINLLKKSQSAYSLRDEDYFGIWTMGDSLVSWFLHDKQNVTAANKKVDLGELSIDQLIWTYNLSVPNFPGMYTIRPLRQDLPLPYSNFNQSKKEKSTEAKSISKPPTDYFWQNVN